MTHHTKNLKTETKLSSLGRDPLTHGRIVNTPIYPASTLVFDNLAALDSAFAGTYDKPGYARQGTPTTQALMDSIAALEGGETTVLTNTGLQAVICSLYTFLSPGDHLLIADTVYDPTRKFCNSMLKPWGVEVEYYDPALGGNISTLMRENTRVVYTESPGSLTFEMQDIPAIAAAAHDGGAIVIGDNTWGGLLNMRPFELGMDVSVQSLTKYPSGHSDLMMGAVTVRQPHAKRLQATHRTLGMCTNAQDAYYLLRGLRTLDVRLKRHEENGLKVAEWLRTRDEVQEVLHPAMPEAPAHDIFKRDFSGACGLFSVVLKPVSRKALAAMVDSLEHFAMGFSWGGYESLIVPCDPSPHRTATPWDKEGQLVRLHIGLEHPDDLIADLQAGFERMAKEA